MRMDDGAEKLKEEAISAARTRPASPQQKLTLDTFIEIFSQTFGSLKGSIGMVLWCWTNYQGSCSKLTDQHPLTLFFCIWFLLVCIYKALAYLNVAAVSNFGKQTWSLKPETDEIVVTGGSSGLGMLTAAIFSANGFRVHIIDIVEPVLRIAHSTQHHCDVSDYTSVAKTVEKICQSTLNKQYVLVNCAGTASGVLGSFANFKPLDIKAVMDINALGSMYLVHAFQNQAKSKLKMVAGIGSATAICGPAHASVYAASKAAVRTFYESLRHESGPHLRVLCFTLGQLDTRMFKRVKTPSAFLAPVASGVDVASKVYDAIVAGRQGEISLPAYAQLLPFANVLPTSLSDALRRAVGVDEAANI